MMAIKSYNRVLAVVLTISLVVSSFMLFPKLIFAKSIEASNYNELVEAIGNANSLDQETTVINVTDDIEVSNNIEISNKNITINGNGNSIKVNNYVLNVFSSKVKFSGVKYNASGDYAYIVVKNCNIVKQMDTFFKYKFIERQNYSCLSR